jgi:hypothetical protein
MIYRVKAGLSICALIALEKIASLFCAKIRNGFKFLLSSMMHHNSKKDPYVILFRAPYEGTLRIKSN